MLLYRKGVGIPNPYQGPGDLFAAQAWWGLRGYSATYAASGGKAIQLIDSSGLNPTDIRILATGGLDTGAVSTFISNHGTPSVSIIYDQSGHSNDLSTLGSSPANNPTLFVSGNGLVSLPSMGYVKANNTTMTYVPGANQSLPYTFNMVANHTSVSAQSNVLQATGNSGTSIGYTAANNQAFGYAGTISVNIAETDGAFHTIGAVFTNSTADILFVDMTQNTGTNMGSHAGVASGSDFNLGQSGSFQFDGFIAEAGWWARQFSSADITALYNQQHGYYGAF